eukprot:9154544-Ditylum_brightwellii.AAC.1
MTEKNGNDNNDDDSDEDDDDNDIDWEDGDDNETSLPNEEYNNTNNDDTDNAAADVIFDKNSNLQDSNEMIVTRNLEHIMFAKWLWE